MHIDDDSAMDLDGDGVSVLYPFIAMDKAVSGSVTVTKRQIMVFVFDRRCLVRFLRVLFFAQSCHFRMLLA